MSATTLLHEAYLDISGRERAFPDRHRFLAYASRVMRGLIIDFARSRHAQKRGGHVEIRSIDTDVPEAVPDCRALTRISDAQDALVGTRGQSEFVERADVPAGQVGISWKRIVIRLQVAA